MAASLLLALLPLGWHNAPVTTDGSYHTLSAAQPESVPAATALRVVFAKSTAEADISKLLAILHAERMGDVNSMGALTVRLDRPENLEPALALLRSRPDVVLAEPALQP